MVLLSREERGRYEEVIRAKWAGFLKEDGGLWECAPVAIILGKGGDPVPRVSDDLELERLRNLILGFGWVIVKHELKTDRISAVIELKREATTGEPVDDSV